MIESLLSCKSDSGTGRPLVVVYDDGEYAEKASMLQTSLAASQRVVVLLSVSITDENWSDVCAAFREKLSTLSIRQASFVAFGAAAALAQWLALTEPKLVRTATFIDATSRPHPSRYQRLVDKIERVLPLGLPLRSSTKGFDARASFHRVRCPVLVITSSESSGYLSSEAVAMSDIAPTAWRISLSPGPNGTAELCRSILEFQEIPAKCPQKNL